MGKWKMIYNLFYLIIILFFSCTKETKPPLIATISVSNISATEATSGGIIRNKSDVSILERGIVWSTTKNPTISLSSKTSNGQGAGAFQSSLNQLLPNTTYFTRAYAVFSTGTEYGNEVSFTTNDIKTNLNDGLVAYFPFNGNANDESGNRNNGTIYGSPKLSTDRFGKNSSAYNFSKKSDYINAKSFNLINGNQARTFSFWAKIPLNTEGGCCISYGPELLQTNSGCNIGNHIDLNQSTAADCGFEGIGFGINCNQIRKPKKINDGSWHNIVISYSGLDGFNGLKCYVDGLLLSSNFCVQGSSSSFNTQSNNNGLTIGRRVDADNYNGSMVSFKVDLDDIRIYNRALSQDEINYLSKN